MGLPSRSMFSTSSYNASASNPGIVVGRQVLHARDLEADVIVLLQVPVVVRNGVDVAPVGQRRGFLIPTVYIEEQVVDAGLRASSSIRSLALGAPSMHVLRIVLSRRVWRRVALNSRW